MNFMVGWAELAFILIPILGLLGFGLLVVVAIVIVKGTNKKERTEQVRISKEEEKIDSMLAEGKVTESEAAELKKAVRGVGTGETVPNAPDTHLKLTGLLNAIFGVFPMIGVGFVLLFFLAMPTTTGGGRQVTLGEEVGPQRTVTIRHGSSTSTVTTNTSIGSDEAATVVTASAAAGRPVEISTMENTRRMKFSVLIGIVVLLAAGIFAVFSILRIVAGISLMKGKRWARPVIVVFSVLEITNIPLGTALGIYSLWTLVFRAQASEYFQK